LLLTSHKLKNDKGKSCTEYDDTPEVSAWRFWPTRLLAVLMTFLSRWFAR